MTLWHLHDRQTDGPYGRYSVQERAPTGGQDNRVLALITQVDATTDELNALATAPGQLADLQGELLLLQAREQALRELALHALHALTEALPSVTKKPLRKRMRAVIDALTAGGVV